MKKIFRVIKSPTACVLSAKGMEDDPCNAIIHHNQVMHLFCQQFLFSEILIIRHRPNHEFPRALPDISWGPDILESKEISVFVPIVFFKCLLE